MEVQELLEIKGASVATIGADGTIEEAARELTAQNIGVLVVVDEGVGLQGVISERDLTKAMASYGSASVSHRVGELMTRRVITCCPEDTIVEALALMDAAGIRHLPVVKDAALVGIISIRDATSAWLGVVEQQNDELIDLVASGP